MMPKATGRWLTLAGLSLMISACGSGQRELQAYIDRIKAQPGGAIEPLPEVRPAPTHVYEPGGRRSPFVPDAPQTAVASNGIRPDPNRAREDLESDPLDSLAMVGTMSNAEGAFGLIQDADGLVHRVRIGNHMGQNYGRITSITETEIELIEMMSDGRGGFYERPASIGLSD